jgi:hypothetical protein
MRAATSYTVTVRGGVPWDIVDRIVTAHAAAIVAGQEGLQAGSFGRRDSLEPTVEAIGEDRTVPTAQF